MVILDMHETDVTQAGTAKLSIIVAPQVVDRVEANSVHKHWGLQLGGT